MNVLAVVHHERVGPALFGECVRARGHRLETHSFSAGVPALPLQAYAAVIVCGGPMNAGDDASHPWLRDEMAFLHRVVESQIPVLGLCLGSQLLARVMNSAVFDASEPEIGWHEVETTKAARADPVCAGLPARFHAFQWHAQTHDLPAGATVLARNRVGVQAYRVGNHAWGMQFHPELTEVAILGWLSHDGWPIPGNAPAIAAETTQRIEAWNDIGRALCAAFLDVAQAMTKRHVPSST